MSQRKKSKKWTWPISILALIVFLDLFALTWYFWSIPVQHFDNWKKIISTLGSWLGSLLTFFGIRYKYKRGQSLEQVLRIRPVQLCIVALTILIWYFILPFHSVTISVYQSDLGIPLSGVEVKVDDEKAPRLTSSDDKGKVKIRGFRASPHNISLERDGYKTKSWTISFVDVVSPRGVLPVRLEKQKGTLEVMTIPEGAEIYLDDNENEAIGTTPKTLTLPTGEYRIMFKKAEYYSTLWEEITISVGDNLLFNRELKEKPKPPPKMYSLTVSSDPQDAQIYIGGKLAGKTLGTLKLIKGKYLIEIRKNGYVTAKDIVSIPERSVITFRLEKIIKNQIHSIGD